MKKVSIIVPIYNREKQLERCITSITNQTYTDIEVILVNDGSTDSSDKICNELIKKDDRLKYIYKENGGVSSARNVGIEASTGEFIMFVDADDTIKQNTISNMIKYSEDYDIVIGNYEKITNTSVIPFKALNKSNELSFLEFITYNYMWEVWGKLFKRSVIKYKFDESIAIGEDSLFWVQNNDNYKYIFLDNIFYSYYQTEPSIMNTTVINERNITTFKAHEKIIDLTEGKIKYFYQNEYIGLYYKYKMIYNDSDKIFYNNKKLFKENVNKYYKELMKSNYSKFSSKIRILLQVKMPYIAKLLSIK